MPPASRNIVASISVNNMNSPAKAPITAAMRPRRLVMTPYAPARVANILVAGTLFRYCHRTAQMERLRTTVVQTSWMRRTRKVPSLPMVE